MFTKLGHFRHGLIQIDRHLAVTAPMRDAKREADRRIEHNTLAEFWNKAWRRYTGNCPEALRLQSLLEAEEETWHHDHVALRTFNLPNINRHWLGSLFAAQGYLKVPEVLHFTEKKLTADYYVHPCENQPKVFISELNVEKMPGDMQEWIKETTKEARVEGLNSLLERSWQPINVEAYKRFYPVSEYAAWTAAFGIQINHFALLTNRLKSYAALGEFNRWLTAHEFELSRAGGLIKGQPSDLLSQSSTVGALVNHRFAEGYYAVPACFVEFAQRFPIGVDEGLFQGFRVENANKIFESTRRD